MSCLGIIIEQSLKDITIINDYTLIAHKQVGNWRLFLVSVPANEVEGHLKKLQESMIDISDDCWYAHFFSQETMVVVYQSTLLKTTIFPKDWDDAIQFGFDNGITIEQLDFNPRTVNEALASFGLKEIPRFQ